MTYSCPAARAQCHPPSSRLYGSPPAGSAELAIELRDALPQFDAAGVKLVVVALGSLASAREFSSVTGFPPHRLLSDSSGSCHLALGYSRGFAASGVSPYVRLLAMLAGLGSPGTIQEVFRGYVGDRTAPPVFGPSSPFDVLGKGYQRPFELATLRLMNMGNSLGRWEALKPQDEEQLLWQGGALVLRGRDAIFSHADKGILDTVSVLALLKAAGIRSLTDSLPDRIPDSESEAGSS